MLFPLLFHLPAPMLRQQSYSVSKFTIQGCAVMTPWQSYTWMVFTTVSLP